MDFVKFDPMARQRLALNYLQNMTDAARDFLPYWLVGIQQKPAIAKHSRVDDAELVPSWSAAMIRVQDMIGAGAGDEQLAAWRRLFHRDIAADGIRYCHPYPWTASDFEHMFIDIHALAYIFDAFCAYHDRFGDAKDAAAAAKMVRAVKALCHRRREINFWGGSYPYSRVSYYFPFDNYYLGAGWKPEKWTGRGEEAVRNAMMVGPLAELYLRTRDEEALDLACGLLNHVLYESRLVTWEGHYNSHVHSVVWIAAGAAKLARITGNLQYGLIAKGIYDHTLARCSSFGWVPEYIGWHAANDEHCETCCIRDMVECGLELAKLGHVEYYDVVDRFVRNHLMESQITKADEVEVDNSRADVPDCTWRDLARRVIGGFSGGSMPNSISLTKFRSVAGCCISTAPQAIWMYWQETLRRDGDLTRIRFLYDGEWPELTVATEYPQVGRVALSIRQGGTYAVLAPAWWGARIALRRNGVAEPVLWQDPHHLRLAAKAGDRIEIEHAFPVETRTETVAGTVYEVEWRGNTVVELFPGGEPLALYQRKLGGKERHARIGGSKGKSSPITPRATQQG